jgi:hypothetical protein
MGIFGHKCKMCGRKLVKKELILGGKFWQLDGTQCMRCNSIICDYCYDNLPPHPGYQNVDKPCPYCGGGLGLLLK